PRRRNLDAARRGHRLSGSGGCGSYRLVGLVFPGRIRIIKINQALHRWPYDADLNRRLGDVYFQMTEYTQALTKYKYALSIDPDEPLAWYSISLCYGKIGLDDLQIEALEKTLRLKPDMVAAMLNLGNIYFSKKMYTSAIGQYQKAASLQPDDAGIHYNIAAAYSNNEQYQKAIPEYLKVIKIAPKMGDAHLGLAVGFYNLQKYSLAFQHLQIAKQLGVEINENLTAAIEQNL
ncbi:MAG: tetratricopeptide repeat protein, partial [Phycisphaerae bacterium]|nr:tetratricopeptide repeat protein [Phycisphaerae bacterium]